MELIEKILMPTLQGIIIPILIWVLKSIHDLKLLKYEIKEETAGSLKEIKDKINIINDNLEDHSKTIGMLLVDYTYRETAEAWEKEMRDSLSDASQYFKDNEDLQIFAVNKGEKFIEHIMYGIANFDDYGIDLVIQKGVALKNECELECERRFGKEFADEYYRLHDAEGFKYIQEIQNAMKGTKNIKRAIFDASLKFMNRFLQVLHETYYKHRREITPNLDVTFRK